MARVVVLGSSNTDLTLRLPQLPSPGQTLLGGPFITGPGGKGANQAVAARRAGADVIFLTAVGDDLLGRQALERYQGEGIDIAHAKIVPGFASGVAFIFVDDTGENMIGVAPGANARLTPDDIDRLPDPVFEDGGVFLASLEVPLETVVRALRRARRAGMLTILNPAPSRSGLVEGGTGIVSPVDVLTPNREEAAWLTGLSLEAPGAAREAARRLREVFGSRDVIITRGAKGCLAMTEDKMVVVPAYPVTALDTVGAGDAFNGALAVALAEGRSLIEAAVWASDAAALAVTRTGAQDGLPSRDVIDDLAAAPHAPPRSFEEDSFDG